MKTKITSTNQSGGVTGQNVSIGGNVQSGVSESVPSVARISWRKVVGWCVSAVAFIGSVLGILEYIGIKLWR